MHTKNFLNELFQTETTYISNKVYFSLNRNIDAEYITDEDNANIFKNEYGHMLLRYLNYNINNCLLENERENSRFFEFYKNREKLINLIDHIGLFSTKMNLSKQMHAVVNCFSDSWNIGERRFKVFSTNEKKQDFSFFYELSADFSSLILAYLYDLIITNTIIKKCRYCGDYFIPLDNKSAIYCNKLNSNGKTCKENGAAEAYRASLNSQIEKNIYHKAYRKVIYLKNNHNITEHAFSNWKISAHERMEQVRANKIPLGEYSAWIDRSVNDLKKG